MASCHLHKCQQFVISCEFHIDKHLLFRLLSGPHNLDTSKKWTNPKIFCRRDSVCGVRDRKSIAAHLLRKKVLNELRVKRLPVSEHNTHVGYCVKTEQEKLGNWKLPE